MPRERGATASPRVNTLAHPVPKWPQDEDFVKRRDETPAPPASKAAANADAAMNCDGAREGKVRPIQPPKRRFRRLRCHSRRSADDIEPKFGTSCDDWADEDFFVEGFVGESGTLAIFVAAPGAEEGSEIVTPLPP